MYKIETHHYTKSASVVRTSSTNTDGNLVVSFSAESISICVCLLKISIDLGVLKSINIQTNASINISLQPHAIKIVKD